MTSAFPEALITGHENIVSSMPNQENDRHVLAAAVYGRVDAIITLNTRHFPEDKLAGFGILRPTPDQFLVHQWHLDPASVRRHVMDQAIACGKQLDSHIDLLHKMAPRFADLLRG